MYVLPNFLELNNSINLSFYIIVILVITKVLDTLIYPYVKLRWCNIIDSILSICVAFLLVLIILIMSYFSVSVLIGVREVGPPPETLSIESAYLLLSTLFPLLYFMAGVSTLSDIVRQFLYENKLFSGYKLHRSGIILYAVLVTFTYMLGLK